MLRLNNIIASLLSVIILCSSVCITANATSKATFDWKTETSQQYRDSQKNGSRYNYYGRLVQNVNNYNKNTNWSYMQRVYKIAKSQLDWSASNGKSMNIGYANYAVSDTGSEKGKTHWQGNIPRNNKYKTGNTEYTRWFFTKFKKYYGPKANCDWCAIFVSWCMYFSGYHKGASDMENVYSICADPGISNIWGSSKGSLKSFNMANSKLTYTKSARNKLRYKGDNKYNYNIIDVMTRNRLDALKINYISDAKLINYRQGGLVFFNWGGTGDKFDHVGIVCSYNCTNEIMTYISGNSGGYVRVEAINLRAVESYKGNNKVENSKRIMAYGEY